MTDKLRRVAGTLCQLAGLGSINGPWGRRVRAAVEQANQAAKETMHDQIVKAWFESNYGYMGRTWADLPEESRQNMRQLWKHA